MFWYGKEEYERALDEVKKAEPTLSNDIWTLFDLAAALGQLGRTEEAARAVDKLLEVYPDFPKWAHEFWAT